MSGIPDGGEAAGIETDPATSIGMMRLLITDLNEAQPLFTDAQLAAFLAAEGAYVKRGAAAALSVMARSEALISKKITTQDLSTDGPAVAKELRASAAELRAEAAAEEAEEDSDYGLEIQPLWCFPTPAVHGDWLL